MKTKPTHSSVWSTLVCITLLSGIFLFRFVTSRTAVLPRQLPAEISAAFCGGQWMRVETMPTPVVDPQVRNLISIMRGYAALSRSNLNGSTTHFLLARHGDIGEPKHTPWSVSETNPLTSFLIADGFIRQGELRRGIATFDSVVAMNGAPPIASAAREVARALSESSNSTAHHENVETWGESILGQVITARAITCLKRGESNSAVAQLNFALEIDPENAIARNARGVALAQIGKWEESIREFEMAFRLLPQFVEARENWQVVQRISTDRGAFIASKWDRSEITVVSAADAMGLKSTTATVSDMIRQKWGTTPLVTKSSETALALSRSGPVILQIPGSGFKAAVGDTMLHELNTLKGKGELNIVCFGNESCDNAAMGILRHQNTTPVGARARIRSLQLLDPTELSGFVGKTPLGQTDARALARNLEKIGAQGVPIAVFTTEDKFGLQHLGNVSAFRNIKGVDLYATPWKARVETGIGLGLGLPQIAMNFANASDKASSRNDLGARDWTAFKNGSERHLVSTLGALGGEYLGRMPLASTALEKPNSWNNCGGVTVGATISKPLGGSRLIFDSASPVSRDLKVVYPIFCNIQSIPLRLSDH